MSEIQCPNCHHVFDPSIDPEWAKRMRSMREQRGIPLRAVARHLGLSVSYLSDIERVRRNKPARSIVAAWEKYLEEAA